MAFSRMDTSNTNFGKIHQTEHLVETQAWIDTNVFLSIQLAALIRTQEWKEKLSATEEGALSQELIQKLTRP